MLEAVGTVLSAAKAAWGVVSGIASRRAARYRTERLRLIRETLRRVQRGRPAALAFSEPVIAEATQIPLEDLPDLLYELERDGFIMAAPFGGYWLRERVDSLGAHRLYS